MLLGFTAIVLVGAVVPLTLNATSHDRNSFSQAAAGVARTDAVIAQDYLSLLAEPKPGKAWTSAVAEGRLSLAQVAKETRQAGYGLLVLHNVFAGSTVVGDQVVGNPVAMPPGNLDQWDRFAAEANDQAQVAVTADQQIQPVTQTVGSYVIAAMPVYGQGGQSGQWVGTVVLASSTQPLDNEILALWVILGSVAAVAMIAAALVAFGLARWVNRPRSPGPSAACSPTGPRSIRGHRSCDGWARRSTPWPDVSKPWCTGTGRSSRTSRTSCARRWPRCGCGWTCSPPTPTRRPGTSWPGRWTNWPGCPGWWTAC